MLQQSQCVAPGSQANRAKASDVLCGPWSGSQALGSTKSSRSHRPVATVLLIVRKLLSFQRAVLWAERIGFVLQKDPSTGNPSIGKLSRYRTKSCVPPDISNSRMTAVTCTSSDRACAIRCLLYMRVWLHSGHWAAPELTAVAHDLERRFANVACRISNGSFAHAGFARWWAGPRPGHSFSGQADRRQSVDRRAFDHPCFAMRLGGVSGGNETQGWRDSSQTAMVGPGKFGSPKLPMATATYPGKPSLSQ